MTPILVGWPFVPSSILPLSSLSLSSCPKATSAGEESFYLLFAAVSATNSFFGFGWPRAAGSYKSWMLQFRDDHGKKEVWGVNRQEDGLFFVVCLLV